MERYAGIPKDKIAAPPLSQGDIKERGMNLKFELRRDSDGMALIALEYPDPKHKVELNKLEAKERNQGLTKEERKRRKFLEDWEPHRSLKPEEARELAELDDKRKKWRFTEEEQKRIHELRLSVKEGRRQAGLIYFKKSDFIPGVWELSQIELETKWRNKGLGKTLTLMALAILEKFYGVDKFHSDWEYGMSPEAIRLRESLIREGWLEGEKDPKMSFIVEEDRGERIDVTVEGYGKKNQGVQFGRGWEGVTDLVYEVKRDLQKDFPVNFNKIKRSQEPPTRWGDS